MLDPQTSQFWQSALRSGLTDARSLSACWNAIPPEKRHAPEHLDRRLARQAIGAGALTRWQAQQLFAGRTKGFKVDRYLLLDVIGEGGMGRVYLATDTRLKRRVALKILAPDRVNNPRAVARFRREGLLGAQLQHENLVRIYDFGEWSGRCYLVMEYIEGKNVGKLIAEQGPMSPPLAVRLIRQVALGLEHAHRKGLIHRDVNPQNILVTQEGTAKLADLGLVLDLAAEDRFTREGATIGTYDYLAPEQARDSHAADIRSDVYSLGCTLYHLISGQVPFSVPSLLEKLIAHQTMDPTPLEQLVPGLPAGLGDVVARMMEKSPEDRYATPLQVALALQPFESDAIDFERGKDLIQSGVDSSPRSQQALDQSQASLTKVLASPPASLQTPLTGRAVTESALFARVKAAESQTAVATPVSADGLGDPDSPFLVDLGPEPSLSEGLPRARSRFAQVFSTTAGSGTISRASEPDTVTSTSDDSPRVPWWLPVWFWGLVTIMVLVTASVVILATARG
ncbi:MAG: serine/threonine-protein kinase [Isosphaeraceae bacterium]